MELDTTAKVRAAFFRLVGTVSDDAELTLHDEGDNEVVDMLLTEGFREAQRWMLTQGFQGWRKRSSSLSFSGTDVDDGGTFAALPTDFMKAYGNKRMSALVEPNGKKWGTEV